MAENPLERAIDQVVASTPALAAVDDKTVNALINDLAEKIWPYGEIADRYGMSMDELLAFCARPGIAARIKARRAVWESGESVSDRARKYAGLVVIEGTAVVDRIIHDPKATPGMVLEAMALVSRNAGIYQGGGIKSDTGGGNNGPGFAVNIVFSNGSSEKITTVVNAAPVIEGDAA